jgi:hypothetical protein
MLVDMEPNKAIDFVLDTNINNQNTRCYMVWDNRPMPYTYINTANEIMTYLSAVNPVITPIENEVNVGCVVPFRLYKNETHQKNHAFVMWNVMQNDNETRYTKVTI